MLASGLAELVSLAVLIPFLSTISNPEYIWRQEFFNPLFLRFSITDSNQLIIPLTILFVISVILSTY